MSIEIKNPSLSSHIIANETRANDVKHEENKPSIQVQQSAINKLSQLFKEAHDIIASTPVVDEARCAMVREKIQNTTWFDADRIADKMLSLEDALFEAKPPKEAK
jgi:anti-sigma28 factor (negative regulator of flagellin synthesis)